MVFVLNVTVGWRMAVFAGKCWCHVSLNVEFVGSPMVIAAECSGSVVNVSACR